MDQTHATELETMIEDYVVRIRRLELELQDVVVMHNAAVDAQRLQDIKVRLSQHHA
jgi:hypothetical protein